MGVGKRTHKQCEKADF